MRPLKCLIASNCHGSYCVPALSKHRPAARAILAGQVWEPDVLGFLTTRCGGGDVIHAGTYFGDFLPALSKAAAPGAHIWAFEPSSVNFRCAEITLKLNELRNVTLTQAALGAEPGTAQLCIGEIDGKAAGGGSAIASARLPGFDYEQVRVVAIDDVVPQDRQVSILQLDVEYYERPALEGALATIRRCRPLLLLETLPPDTEWFAAHTLALGYELLGIFDKNSAFRAVPA